MSRKQCDKPHLGLRLAGGKSDLMGVFFYLCEWLASRPGSTRTSTGHRSMSTRSCKAYETDGTFGSKRSRSAVRVTATPYGSHVVHDVPRQERTPIKCDVTDAI